MVAFRAFHLTKAAAWPQQKSPTRDFSYAFSAYQALRGRKYRAAPPSDLATAPFVPGQDRVGAR